MQKSEMIERNIIKTHNKIVVAAAMLLLPYALRALALIRSANRISSMPFPTARIFFASALVCLGACIGSAAQGRSLEILVTFDYPGASSTIAFGIDQKGDVTGGFTDSTSSYAYIRYKNGTFSPPLTDPNDSQGQTAGTDFNGSELVGNYYDPTNGFHSFLYTEGMFTSLDPVGATSTAVNGVNSAGDYSGWVNYGSWVTQGFINSAGQLTEFAIPGASFTSANAISTLGSVAGVYQLTTGAIHGFVRDVSGNLTYPIDYPSGTYTIPRGINSSGWIAGSYVDAQLVQHGFLFRPPDAFISYTYPGSTSTSLEGINDRGQTCGQFIDTAGLQHAFIARLR